MDTQSKSENVPTGRSVPLLDLDGDRLDDRLAASGSGNDDTIRSVVKRVSKLTLSNLPQHILQRMLTDVEESQRTHLESAQELEVQLHRDLVRGDPSSLRRIRSNIRHLGRESELLERQRVRIYNALQQRTVDDGMAARLGNKRRADIFEWFIMGLIIFVLGLLAYDMNASHLDPGVATTIFYIDIGCCVIFLGDFFLRLSCASSKTWFWRNNWIDFVTSIPLPSAQIIRYGRAFRLIRLVRLLRLLRALRVLMKLFHGMEKLGDVLDMNMMKKSLKWLVVIMFLGAAVIYFSERHVTGKVDSAGQSLWWSFTTVVTGGFADIHNPSTGSGRVLTVFLIIAGMIVVGVFTATLTSLYMADETEAMELRQDAMDEVLTDLQSAHENHSNDLKEIRQALGIQTRPPEK